MSTSPIRPAIALASVEELVDRIGDGDLAAFHELRHRLNTGVLVLIRHTVIEPDQAAAVADGVWLEVWWLSRLGTPGDVLAWLRAIVARRSEERRRLVEINAGSAPSGSRTYDEHVRAVLQRLLDADPSATSAAAVPARRRPTEPAGTVYDVA